MAIFPIQNYYVFNGEIKPVNEFEAEENSGSVYEVLRVIRGVPLFLGDHLKRLTNSVELAGFDNRYSENEVEEFLIHLIHANQVSEGNILISIKESLAAYFIPHKYPGQALFEKGIMLGILHAERQNPHAKVFQTSVREQADKMKLANDFYEVLLVDHFKKITEGSSSNVFFILNNKLITAPIGEVLPGITREKTIRLADALDIEMEERSVFLDELSGFEAAFITGTSPKILPVKQIDDKKFDPQNRIIKDLINAYDNLIEDYVSAR